MQRSERGLGEEQDRDKENSQETTGKAQVKEGEHLNLEL